MDLQALALPVLATVTVGGVLYAVLDPLLSGSSAADKRKAALATRSTTPVAGRGNETARRKKQVADSLKEIDARARSKAITFEAKMAQAGLTWTKQKYAVVCVVLGLVAGLACCLLYGISIIAAGVAISAGIGAPRWYVSSRRKRRVKKFLAEFPSAIDVIVRGIKAGIPLGDCLRNISMEAAEPIRSEFRQIVEMQSMGLTLGEAVERIIDRVPTPEASFFSIVINIQAKAGGNLAEALTNLSNVLRDRKKMRGKIKAMSSEAKASAGIIGALPFVVAFLVYLTSPDYIALLFSTSTGNIVLGISGFWMALGVFIMKKMINFDM